MRRGDISSANTVSQGRDNGHLGPGVWMGKGTPKACAAPCLGRLSVGLRQGACSRSWRKGGTAPADCCYSGKAR